MRAESKNRKTRKRSPKKSQPALDPITATDSPRPFICPVGVLSKAVKDTQNLGVWGAYETFPHPRRICIDANTESFIKQVYDLHADGQIKNPQQISVITAVNEKLLFDPGWENEIRTALHTIAAAKVKEDDAAISRFESALRSNGEPSGPKTKSQTHRDMVEVLKRSKAGEGMKEIAGADEGNKQLRALHTNVRRFCLEVYDVWMRWSLLNPQDDPEKYNQLIEKHLRESCDFDLPSEESIALLAFNRAKNKYRAASR